MTMLSYTFLITGYKGLHTLRWFCANFESRLIQEVVSEPDKNVIKDYFEEIKNFCISKNILFSTRRNEIIPGENNYCFAIGWRWIFPVHDRTIIFHDSLLPRYRGFAPIVNALINGESKIGATALRAAQEYDRGGIILQESFTVIYPIKIAEAIYKVSELYCLLLQKILNALDNNVGLPLIAQTEKEASYSLWRDEEDYRIDWSKHSSIIKREIDAMGYPYKGAYALQGDRRCIINDAVEIDDVVIENRSPGKVIFLQNGFPVIVCGVGLLKIIAAVDAATGESIFPMNKIRCRFN